MPYRTWINGTSPPINANNLNSLQEMGGWVNVKDRSLTDGGANGDGTTDDRAAIQSAIDSLPARGGVVYFPAGNYKVNASAGIGLDLSAKDSVTLQGEFGTSFNETLGTRGTCITAGSSSMTLLKCDGGASVKQFGPRIRNINLGSDQASTKLARFEMVNHWGFEDCTFSGAGSGLIALELDIPTTDHPSGDNNWNFLERCRFSFASGVGTSARAINALECGFFAHNCVFNLETGMMGIRAIKAQGLHLVNCYFTGGTSTTGHAIYSEGGFHDYIGCHFENITAGANASIKLVEPGGALPYQGRSHKIIGCTFASGATAIDVGTGVVETLILGNVYAVTTQVVDSGGGTLILDGDFAKIAGWSGAKLGFYGTAPASKQTVTGSRGGNAALGSLLSALSAYGFITDSTSA